MPKGVAIGRPPAFGTPPSAVWQATQLPSAASWRPRSSTCGLYSPAALACTGAMAPGRRPRSTAPRPISPVAKAPTVAPAIAHTGLRRRCGSATTGGGGGAGAATGGGAGSGLIAARTTSGVNGALRKRTPVASKIALAMAAVPGTEADSPAPSGGSPGRGISSTSTTGTSRKLRMG